MRDRLTVGTVQQGCGELFRKLVHLTNGSILNGFLGGKISSRNELSSIWQQFYRRVQDRENVPNCIVWLPELCKPFPMFPGC